MYMHHQQQLGSCQQNGSLIDIRDTFRLGDNHSKDSDYKGGSSIVDYNKGESGKNSMSDEDDPSFTEEGQNEAGKVKKGSPWHRMKWTDAMVKLLITGVSYVGDDDLDCGSIGGKRRKHMILQKKGKWKAISKVMTERGCCVSPQQCEDKFNDLNKRYKRLTDILGRGTSCKVVENPALLDHMNHLTEKQKDAARKILNSKHLFYEEMCSYHNCNRLNLPHDPALQRSIQLALNSKDEHDTKRGSHEDFDEDNHSADSDEDADGHNNIFHGSIGASCFPNSTRQGIDDDTLKLANCSHSQDYKGNYQAQGLPADINRLLSESSDPHWMNQQLSSYSRELEEKRLHIEAEMLELEEQKFKWQRFSEKKNRELNRMMLENERMKIENERMSLILRQKKLEIDLVVKRNQ